MRLLDVTGPIEVFTSANDFGGRYRLELVSADGRDVITLAGTRLGADLAVADLRQPSDVLIIPGGPEWERLIKDDAFLDVVRQLNDQAGRTASVCTGAFLLAAAGLLDGRRATTHWRDAGQLALRFPAVQVEPDAIFVQDGRLMTSAGVSAGIDLSLAIVEKDYGAQVARAVAKDMVVFMPTSSRSGWKPPGRCWRPAMTPSRWSRGGPDSARRSRCGGRSCGISVWCRACTGPASTPRAPVPRTRPDGRMCTADVPSYGHRPRRGGVEHRHDIDQPNRRTRPSPVAGALDHLPGPGDAAARRDRGQRRASAHPARSRFSATSLAWVVNGYTVTYGGLLMLGGRMGDLLGRRRMFTLGLAVFALASASAGLAQQPGVLVASRFVQGTGAALASPAALSLLTLLFARPQERARAMAIWSGLAGVGAALGVMLSGVLTDLASWRWIFIGLAAPVSLGASHAAVLQHAGLDRMTAAADGYALSFAIAAGVTGFGALLGFFGITRRIPARPARPETRPGEPEAPTVREPVELER